MTVQVEVLEKDIEKGMPECGFTCPIARATLRALKATPLGKFVREVFVDAPVTGDRARIEIFTKNGHFTPWVATPKKAAKFITKFDKKGTAKPLSFVLKLDDMTVEQVFAQ